PAKRGLSRRPDCARAGLRRARAHQAAKSSRASKTKTARSGPETTLSGPRSSLSDPARPQVSRGERQLAVEGAHLWQEGEGRHDREPEREEAIDEGGKERRCE